MTENANPTHRSGFACFVGRPNAGKSTLTNALVGAKIAIASSKPQTTRHAVRGILTRPDGQLVLIDTPGLHRPRTLLGQRLNALVYDTWSEVDVVGVCLPCDQRIGPGDKYILSELAKLERRPIFVAVATKTDLVSKQRQLSHLADISKVADELGIEWAEVIPCSAVAGEQVDLVADALVALLPEGPRYYPDGELTDEPEETLIAELIREAALEGVRDELPHSIAVMIDEILPREPARGQAAAGRVRHPRRGARLAEGHRHRAQGGAAARHRHQGACADQRPARHPHSPETARQGDEGVAARRQVPQPAGLLSTLFAHFGGFCNYLITGHVACLPRLSSASTLDASPPCQACSLFSDSSGPRRVAQKERTYL